MLQIAFEHTAIALGAVSGVLAAAGKKIDLIGVFVLALVTAFGGGTIRDLMLGDTPVAWVRNQSVVVTALIAAAFTFVAARRWRFPGSVLQAADAVSLAGFTIMGARKALLFPETPAAPLAAAVLGVITGVAGGLVRDIMANEIPLIFRRSVYLYASAAFGGAVFYVWCPRGNVLTEQHIFLIAAGIILITRLAAIRWRLALPEFETRPPD